EWCSFLIGSPVGKDDLVNAPPHRENVLPVSSLFTPVRSLSTPQAMRLRECPASFKMTILKSPSSTVVHRLQTPTSNKDVMCAGWPACSARHCGALRKQVGRKVRYGKSPRQTPGSRPSPPTTGWRPRGEHRHGEKRP